MIEAIIQKLTAEAPELGPVKGAVDFGALVAGGQMPQTTFSAYVLPAGLIGRTAESATGMFVQTFDEAVSIILAIRSFEASGTRAIDPLRTLVMSVCQTLGGWAPGDESGVLTLRTGRLVSMQAGLVVYQIDFTLTDQMRIAR